MHVTLMIQNILNYIGNTKEVNYIMIEEKEIAKIVLNLADKFYNDTLQPSAQELGYVMGRIAHSLRIVGLIGLVGDAAVIAEKILKEKMEKFLYDSFSKTPNEKRVLPDPTIICPLLENVANSFNKEDIVKLYSNLLSAATNKDTVEKVHPAFVNIISQMTPLDAKLFNRLNNPFYLAICNSYTEKSSKQLQDIFLDDEFTEIRADVSLSINNLERLGLICVKFNMITTFASSMHQETINRLKKTRYYKECIQTYGESNVHACSVLGTISELGIAFRNICYK